MGEGEGGDGRATLHVPEGPKAAWNVYPWNEWFLGGIVDDIKGAPTPNDDGNVDTQDVLKIYETIQANIKARKAKEHTWK